MAWVQRSLWVLGLGMVISGVYYVGSSTYHQYRAKAAALEHLKHDRQALEEEVRRIQGETAYYQQAGAQMQCIREKLQMGYDNETIYMY